MAGRGARFRCSPAGRIQTARNDNSPTIVAMGYAGGRSRSILAASVRPWVPKPERHFADQRLVECRSCSTRRHIGDGRGLSCHPAGEPAQRWSINTRHADRAVTCVCGVRRFHATAAATTSSANTRIGIGLLSDLAIYCLRLWAALTASATLEHHHGRRSLSMGRGVIHFTRPARALFDSGQLSAGRQW